MSAFMRGKHISAYQNALNMFWDHDGVTCYGSDGHRRFPKLASVAIFESGPDWHRVLPPDCRLRS